jgi:hypothetical protein
MNWSTCSALRRVVVGSSTCSVPSTSTHASTRCGSIGIRALLYAAARRRRLVLSPIVVLRPLLEPGLLERLVVALHETAQRGASMQSVSSWLPSSFSMRSQNLPRSRSKLTLTARRPVRPEAVSNRA